MPVREEKLQELRDRMENLGIHEEDLEEKFILGSGRGGQKIQKTASCVFLKHLPTGISLKCQRERSREINRFLARRMLCDLIEEKVFKKKTKRQEITEKIRKQKKRKARRKAKKSTESKNSSY